MSTANSATSLFADIFRRDSRKASLGGVGTHQALSTRDRDGDDAMPLEEFDNPDVVSSPPTPEPENPFETPNASRTSLNIPGHSVIMTESDTLPDELTGAGSSRNLQVPVPHRPTLQASSSFATSEGTPEKKKKAPPPPQPLDLPPPRAPPPIDDTADTPGTDKQPQPVPTPSPEPPVREEENEQTRERERGRAEEKPPVKWWHEWLCGCGEGPDRGGDHQVRSRLLFRCLYAHTGRVPMLIMGAIVVCRPVVRIHSSDRNTIHVSLCRFCPSCRSLSLGLGQLILTIAHRWYYSYCHDHYMELHGLRTVSMSLFLSSEPVAVREVLSHNVALLLLDVVCWRLGTRYVRCVFLH